MLQLGQIDYLNVQPLYHTLLQHLRGPVQVISGVPTALNRALMDGAIDLAPISAIAAASHTDKVVVLPNLSIASLGAVRTVLLFSWRSDLHELDGRTVALTDHSATSVALLQVLCRERYGIAPNFVVMPQQLDVMLASADAALVIGDTALVEAVRHRAFPRSDLGPTIEARPYIFDLGDEWLKMTGLPFVFALWAARRDRVDALLQSDAASALQRARAEGLANIPTIAAKYAVRLGIEPGTCATYLRDLRYDLGTAELAGLNHFLSAALPNFDPTALEFLSPDSAGTVSTLAGKLVAPVQSEV